MAEFTKNFPSQVVSDLEKDTYDYGLKVARAIEHEWFDGASSIENFVNPCNAPLEPLPSTVPLIS